MSEEFPNTSVENRGSLWRKWDLHVHTPASALANEFKDWDSYIDAIEQAGVGVSVYGVTDYCSIEGYKKVCEYREAGRLGSFDLILPNIEFRTHPETPQGRGINIHILVDPTAPDHIKHIEEALSHLTFRYGAEGKFYACTTQGLKDLGRAHDPSQTDEWGAFRHGVNNFKPSFEKIQDWLEKEGRWLRTNGVIVITNGKDGPSGLSKDAGFAAAREELYRLAEFIFSANPADRKYFLGQGTDNREEVIRKTGSLKPCIHGSDAHEEAKLFEPDQQRYCWIKADPTFEGLRQLVHEPEDRVSIGPTPPKPIDQSKIIDRIELTGAEAWLGTSSLSLNPGLVGIIGEKGSGKTALAELIAFACSAWKPLRTGSSFIGKARPHIDDLVVKVTWADGRVTGGRRIGDGPSSGLPEVRYLSQDFVEELCTRDLSGNQLIREIEEVVFSYIADADRLDAANFEGLRRLRTEHIERRKVACKERLATTNRTIADLEDQITGRSEKLQQIAKCTEDIAAIDAQLPALQATVDQAVADELKKLSDLLQIKSTSLGVAKRRVSRLATIKERVIDYERRLADEFAQLEPLLEEAGFTAIEIDAYKPKLAKDRALPFERLEGEAAKAVMDLSGDPSTPNPVGETVSDLQVRIEALQAKLAADEQQRERLVSLLAQKQKVEGDRQRLEKEIKRLDEAVTATLNGESQSRWTTYLEYFKLLAEERTALTALYDPLKKVIAEDVSGARSGFELNVRVAALTDDWLARGLELFDKRRAVPITDKSILSELEKTLFEAWKALDADQIRAGLDKLLGLFGEPATIDQLLVSHADRRRVYDWLFSTEHVKLDYSLRYQGSELEVLSPGTRGIVLLVLYLAMDQQDRRPLIIDQPEGNLDNSSVYEGLVPFLRQAKRSRQVILVSHNPNLVVTTDADQVIVATATRSEERKYPILSYSSGSLEDAGTETAIRSQTVRLLEGGSKPFKMRENRYALPTDAA